MRKVLLVLVLATAGLATGCGGGGEEKKEARGEISFLVFGDPEELVAYRNVVKAFRKVEPKVTVDLVEASDRDDLLARLSTSFAGGNPPDLFLLNYRFYGQFAARGVLAPVEKRVDDSEVFQQEDFYQPALDAFRFGGTLTCLPQNISSLVVYYNNDLFAKAGVPEPQAGWTWDEFVENGGRAHQGHRRRRQHRPYGVGVEPTIIRLAPFVWANGGEIVDDRANPTRFTLGTPAAIDTMEKLFDLRRTHGVTPSEEEVESEDDETRFQNGAACDGALLPTLDADFPHHQGLRLGRRAAAAARAAGGHPALRRVLHDEGLRRQGSGVAVHRVRARAGGAAHHRQERPDGAVAEGSRAVGGVSRSAGQARELARLPRYHSGDQARPEHLHVARDRRCVRRRSSRRASTRASRPRKSRSSSTTQRAVSSPAQRGSWQSSGSPAFTSGTTTSRRSATWTSTSRRGAARPGWAVGVRQDHGPSPRRRARGGNGRTDLDRRPRRHDRPAGRTQRLDGLPELRAVPAPERRREHRVRAARSTSASETPRRRGSEKRLSWWTAQRCSPASRTSSRAGSASAWPSPVRSYAIRRLPPGRAALEPGRAAARAHARGAQAAAPARRRDDGLRHARPGRGSDDGRPCRRPAIADPPAARDPRRGLPAAGEPLRRAASSAARR